MLRTQEYNSTDKRRNSKQKGKFTEADATKRLQSIIYHGVGPQFLGWKFDEHERLEDGSWKLLSKARPAFWITPTENLYMWSPMRDHLQGCFRGLVSIDAKYVPFIPVDHDRHSDVVFSITHIREVLATGRLLKSNFSNSLGYRLSWCVEVNPRNGSVKFFGWSHRPIPIQVAEKIGEKIHKAMQRNGIIGVNDSREVFPFNHSQVLLPMRIDKKTIVDTGVLGKCVRRKKNYDTGKMVDYETYSVLDFCRWLESNRHFCQRTLETELKKACAALPDRLTEVDEDKPNIKASGPRAVRCAPSPAESIGKANRIALGKDIRKNPNSFERQWDALLVFCRRVKRVATEGEALAYIKANKLYSGEWNDNRADRSARVRWILRRIAKTFDASKCRGVRHDIPIGKYDQWAKNHVGLLRAKDKMRLDEYGNTIVRKSRYRVDWQFASTFLSIVEFSLITSPNEDKSLPQDRAVDLWNRCYEGGLTSVRFNDKKWAICRDRLEEMGVVIVFDRNKRRGKAMRWKVGKDFHRLHEWWRRDKKVGMLENVCLEEFLERKRRDPQPLNSYTIQGVQEKCDSAWFDRFLVRPPP